MNDAIEAGAVQRPLERLIVGEVGLDRREGVPVIAAQLGIAVALEGDAVIIVEIVDPDDLVAAGEEAVGDMMADEAGRAGHENLH
jgi:hypothetical protein